MFCLLVVLLPFERVTQRGLILASPTSVVVSLGLAAVADGSRRAHADTRFPHVALVLTVVLPALEGLCRKKI